MVTALGGIDRGKDFKGVVMVDCDDGMLDRLFNGTASEREEQAVIKLLNSEHPAIGLPTLLALIIKADEIKKEKDKA